MVLSLRSGLFTVQLQTFKFKPLEKPSCIPEECPGGSLSYCLFPTVFLTVISFRNLHGCSPLWSLKHYFILPSSSPWDSSLVSLWLSCFLQQLSHSHPAPSSFLFCLFSWFPTPWPVLDGILQSSHGPCFDPVECSSSPTLLSRWP